TATKERLALQDESRSLLERQRRIEDDELELMERQEEIGVEAAGVTAELAIIAARAEAVGTALAEATAGIEAEIAEASRFRAEAAASVSPEILARYEAIAPEFDGSPLARFVGGRCDGCHMQLSAMAVDRLSHTGPDEIASCEECGRLLIR
ncbi:MAG: C4-type zinc ribbon domain-containing protein, partial [Acidimicrobiia bacterium]|nr:C4-type zinc ribbon domain-containing protein [Acidimicrobiia bacterium]